MPKRETFELPEVTKTIKGKDGREHHLDMVRDIYIKNDTTLERMAQDYQLPKATLERLARSGEHSWNKLKIQHESRWLKVINERFDDSLKEKQSLVQRLEEISLMKMAYRIAEIEDHYKRYGDFFIRDESGEIIRDSRGQALELKLPNDPKDLMILKGLEEAKITNMRLLSERLEMREEAQKAEAMDVDALMSGDLDDA